MAGAASAIVVVVDRLGSGYLGPYGNTWLDTPHFNRLASQSLLCETVVADSPDLMQAYRAWWTGRHALEPSTAGQALPRLAAEAGLHTLLLTDERSVAEHADAESFETRKLYGKSHLPPSDSIEETQLGRLFLSAIGELSELREPALVWIHSQGMAGPWDAPAALRQQFAAEDDPVPPDFVDPPTRHFGRDADPDELLGIVHAYAGQVALLDACLGVLLDALDESPLASRTLLAVASPRGYSLGEHGSVGPTSELYGEVLQVPLLVRLPHNDSIAAAERTQRLIQPCDLHATLVDWLDLPGRATDRYARSLLPLCRGDSLPPRELAVALGLEQRAARTRAWMLRESLADGETQHALFAKPDDRWEVNEVASRCPEVVELLAAAADRFQQAAAAGGLASPAPLAEVLCDTRR